MGLTSAMYTGLSGLNTNQYTIDTIGNNVANMNTTGFKASRADFQNQFTQTINAGSPPSETTGGTNPMQIGLGSVLGGVMRLHTQGSIETTGVPTDMAIEGNGFFVLSNTDNKQLFSRDGSFSRDGDNYLVSQDGYRVQGYGIDQDFNITPGILSDINIPIGSMTIASQTDNAQIDGNLDADGTISTQGSVLIGPALVSDAGGTPAATATLLTDLRSATAPGVPLLAAGDTITVTDYAKKGGRDVAESTYTVAAGDTLETLSTWLTGALGLAGDTAPTTVLDDSNPASISRASGWYVSTGQAGEPAAGTFYAVGDHGTDNALTLGPAALQVDHSGTTSTPFTFTQSKAANGASVYTSFVVYDSLGTAVNMDLTAVMESKTNSGTTWRWYGESVDDTGNSGTAQASRFIGQGTISFNTEGQFLQSPGSAVVIHRDDTGASTPLQVELDFNAVTCLSTAANAGAGNPTRSILVMTTQDGFAAGTLQDFGVGTDGTVTGTFSNGLQRTLGQLALANFNNPEGLVAQANNTYALGSNSGLPIITTPLTLGAGRIMAGSLELSNVDLSKEFIGLVTASTGFSASGRVITTSDQLLQELMTLTR